MSHTGITVTIVLAACALYAPAARAQTPQPRAELTPVEVSASLSFAEAASSSTDRRAWRGPGLSVAVNGNVTRVFAVATEVESYFGQGASALAGAQVRTGFYYGSGRDRTPGRFLAKALAGVVDGSDHATRAAMQFSGGADVVLSGSGGVGLHWEIGYRIVPGDPVRRARGLVAIGIIFGPHLSSAACHPAW